MFLATQLMKRLFNNSELSEDFNYILSNEPSSLYNEQCRSVKQPYNIFSNKTLWLKDTEHKYLSVELNLVYIQLLNNITHAHQRNIL